MTGRQWTTTSPSSVSSSRSTPWVEGCCGPMLTVNSSRGAASSGRASVPGRTRSVMSVDLSGDSEVDRLGAEGLGAPQRVTPPGVGQHDAPQIRVSRELDPEQVEHLAL